MYKYLIAFLFSFFHLSAALEASSTPTPSSFNITIVLDTESTDSTIINKMSDEQKKGHGHQIPEAAGVGISMEDAQKEMEDRHGKQEGGSHHMSPGDIYKKDMAKAQHMMELGKKAGLGKDEMKTQDKSDKSKDEL